MKEKKGVKDDPKVFDELTGKIGLLFMELGKTVRKAGLGEYQIDLDMLNLTKLFRHLSKVLCRLLDIRTWNSDARILIL